MFGRLCWSQFRYLKGIQVTDYSVAQKARVEIVTNEKDSWRNGKEIRLRVKLRVEYKENSWAIEIIYEK